MKNHNPIARRRRRNFKNSPIVSLLLIAASLLVGLIPTLADERANGLTMLALLILAAATTRIVARRGL